MPHGSRILIVEDEEQMATVIQAYLDREGFATRLVTDGRDVEAVFGEFKPDLMILDLMLPGADGLEICRRIRAQSDVYILMLTAKTDEIDKLLGFKLGADDYVTKPFSPRELVARVQALLVRPRRRGEKNDGEDGRYRLGSLWINTETREVHKDGVVLDLTSLEFELLQILAQTPGKVFPRDQLIDRIWGADYVGDDRVVDVHIYQLRQKIEDDPSNPAIIRTVRGVGYKAVSASGASFA